MKTMSISDDDLQRMVEEGKSGPSDNRDLMSYQKLFAILGEPSAFRSTGIEDAVISKIELSRKRSTFREHLWLVAGIVLLMLIGIGAVTISSYRVALSGWQQHIIALGSCAGLVIILLNTIERKLLHH